MDPRARSLRTRSQFSENQSRVSKNQSTVSENLSMDLQEPDHCSLRIRAHLSWRTGKHFHVLHVLVLWFSENRALVLRENGPILVQVLSYPLLS